MGTPGAPPCSFFARGACRNGDACRFSHAVAAPAGVGPPGFIASQPPAQAAPPPTVVNLPPGAPVYSIDVECVAPQSLITYPSKPSVAFRSCASVVGFSQLQNPLILL